MSSKPLAKFEFDLLAFLSQSGGLSVRDVYEQFGKAHGFVRGTIVKGMDRLFKKGHVEREVIEGTFIYRAKLNSKDLDRQLVESFIKERLGGRLTPIALFLSDAKGLDAKEMKHLKELLDKMEP